MRVLWEQTEDIIPIFECDMGREVSGTLHFQTKTGKMSVSYPDKGEDKCVSGICKLRTT